MPTVGKVTGISNAVTLFDSQRLFNRLKGRLTEIQKQVVELEASIVERKQDKLDLDESSRLYYSPYSPLTYDFGGSSSYNPTDTVDRDDATGSSTIVNRKYLENTSGYEVDVLTASVIDTVRIYDEEDPADKVYTTNNYERHYYVEVKYLGITDYLSIDCIDYEYTLYQKWYDGMDYYGIVTWTVKQTLRINGVDIIYYSQTNHSYDTGVGEPAIKPDGDSNFEREGDWGWDIDEIMAGLKDVYDRYGAYSSDSERNFLEKFYDLPLIEITALSITSDVLDGYTTGASDSLASSWEHDSKAGFPTYIKLRTSATLGNDVSGCEVIITFPIDNDTDTSSYSELFLPSNVSAITSDWIDVGSWDTKGQPSNLDLEVTVGSITLK